MFQTTFVSGCGESLVVYENTTLKIFSPNYPNQYPDNTTCEVNISAPDASSRLSVAVSNLDIEYEYECRYDYLEVITNIKKPGLLCGLINGLVFNQTSYQSWVKLRFVSDRYVGGTGYEIEIRVARLDISVSPAGTELFGYLVQCALCNSRVE